jgi:hypothetical protein
MLTLDDLHARQESALSSGLWCEAIAYTCLGPAVWLGSKPATTPRLALRWLRSRAQDIADQLDPATAWPLRAWADDVFEQDRVLLRLTQGGFYTVTVCEDTTRYVLSARCTPERASSGG